MSSRSMWMRNMQVLGILLGTFTLVTAQYRHRHPGFQNTRTPLSTSASKERPYVSIPIVLMPDGQVVPKPTQASYQYLGNLQNHLSSLQNHQQDSRVRVTSMVNESGSNYQIVLPTSSSSYAHHSGPSKSSKQNGHQRNAGSSQKQHRGNNQSVQQNHPQTQAYHVNQKNPGHVASSNQQIAVAHNQNVANFLNFATQLGADVLSNQRNAQPNQQSNVPQPSEITYTPAEPQKVQETYTVQGSSPTHQQMNGNIYLQAHAQGNSAQVFQNHQPVQGMSHNFQQMQNPQHQGVQQATNQQYTSSSNSRQPVQGMSGQNQQNNMQQNGGATMHFSGNQNGPAQANMYSQAPQYSLQQNYGSNPNQGVAQPVNSGTYSPQQMKTTFNPQPVLEIASYDVNSHAVNPNYAITTQGGQSYTVIDSNGSPINYANSAHASPVMYQHQQSGVQIPQSNSPQNIPSNLGQGGDQKLYAHYQNFQDSPASTVNAQHTNYPQHVQQSDSVHNGGPQSYTVMPNIQNFYTNQNGQPVMLKQQTTPAPSIQNPQLVSYTYTNEQSFQSEQQQGKQEQNFPTTSHYQSSTPPTNTYQSSVSANNNYQNSAQATSNYQNSAPATSNYQSSAQATSNYQNPASANSNYQSSLPATSSYQSSHPASSNYQSSQQRGTPKQESTSGGGQLIYASTSSKQINYTPSDQSYASSQQQSNVSPVQSSSSYVSFPSSNPAYEQESSSPAKYESGVGGLITPGSTYVKLPQNSAPSDQTSSPDQNAEDNDYDDAEEEETSYKVVYIPLDILKNILTNNVANQRSEKQS